MEPIYQIFTGEYLDLSAVLSVGKVQENGGEMFFEITFRLSQQPMKVRTLFKSGLYGMSVKPQAVIDRMGFNETFTTEERLEELVELSNDNDRRQFVSQYEQFISDWKEFKNQSVILS